MPSGLRIVAFNVLPQAHDLVAAWADRNGHQIILVVTTPLDDPDRYGPGQPNIVTAVPPYRSILVTRKLKTVAAPAIAALAPDLIVSATFPMRIPPEVAAIPRLGAVNLHPAPLPRGRGPNPMRLLYEGDLVVGAALHRIVPEFDAGPILSRRTRRLPEAMFPGTIFSAWAEMLAEVLEEGTARAIEGEAGEPQDETLATYAAPFSLEERVLTWDEPALALQRKAAALNLVAPTALGHVEGAVCPLQHVEAISHPASAPPGTVLTRGGDEAIIQVADGAVRVRFADAAG